MSTWDEAYEKGIHLKHWDYIFPSQELVAFVASGLIPEKSNCVDFGCGSGNEALFLAGCGYHVTGVDVSGKALEIASKKSDAAGLKINWLKNNVCATNIDSNSIDFINDRGCFHHVQTNDLALYATEVLRILKPGGFLFLRGCREIGQEDFSTLVNEKCVDEVFEQKYFSRGMVLPITLISDAGKLFSNLVVLKKK